MLWNVYYHAPDGTKTLVGQVGAIDKEAAKAAARMLFMLAETRDNLIVKKS